MIGLMQKCMVFCCMGVYACGAFLSVFEYFKVDFDQDFVTPPSSKPHCRGGVKVKTKILGFILRFKTAMVKQLY